MGKKIDKYKESPEVRKERLRLSKTTTVKVIPDKTVYTRKGKHKNVKK